MGRHPEERADAIGMPTADAFATIEANTAAIVAMAWSRQLGLTDDLLPSTGRHAHVVADSTWLGFLQLAGTELLVGPGWALEACAEHPAAELAEPSGLLRVAAAPGPSRPANLRLVTAQALSYADDVARPPGLDEVTMDPDPQTLARLLRSCPPDDVTDAEVEAWEHRRTLLDTGGAPVAAAGYALHAGILAQIGVLTAPPQRRRGHALYAAAGVTADALDEGLVPEWRTYGARTGVLRLAERLGFRLVGTWTVVELG